MGTRKSGYFIVYRDVWKHKVFKNLIESSLWLYMISSATHEDKTLNFLDNRIFVKRGELIFPLRKNSTFWKITYSEMRTFILRLKRRGMITTRLAQLTPTSNHPRRNITIISVINYDKFQYVDKDQPAPDQLSPLTNTLESNTLDNNISIKNNNGFSKEIIYTGNVSGEWNQVKIKGKLFWKHRFKTKEPMRDKI